MSRIDGQFSARTIEMLDSPAHRVLSRAAHHVLARIEIEHGRHGGKDNGRLPVTFDQFVEYGIHRQAIAPAIRELVALGFIEITRQGRAGNADWRRPTLFRLTYRDCFDFKPTHEWRQITETDADMIAKGARRPRSNSAKARNFHSTVFVKSSDENRTESQYGNRTMESKNAQKPHSTETVTTSRLALHLGGLGSDVQQPADALAQTAPDPWADLDIPEFLWRGGPR
jgi:hypothetical protein